MTSAVAGMTLGSSNTDSASLNGIAITSSMILFLISFSLYAPKKLGSRIFIVILAFIVLATALIGMMDKNTVTQYVLLAPVVLEIITLYFVLFRANVVTYLK